MLKFKQIDEAMSKKGRMKPYKNSEFLVDHGDFFVIDWPGLLKQANPSIHYKCLNG